MTGGRVASGGAGATPAQQPMTRRSRMTSAMTRSNRPGPPPPSHRPAEVPTAACAARAGRPAEWRERRHLPLPLPRTPRRHGLVQRLGEPPSHPSAIPTASSTLSPTSGGPGHQASTTPSPGVFMSGDGHALCVTSTQGQLSIPTARAPTLSIPVRLAPSAVHARFHNELLTMDFPSAFCNKNGVPHDYEFATRVETIPFRTLLRYILHWWR